MMHYNYQITFKKDEPFDINYVLEVCRSHPNSQILLEVANTRGIKKEDISSLPNNVSIRIAGAYDDERLRIYKNEKFGNEDCNTYYRDSVIYSRNEIVKLIDEMEKIEKGISPIWSDLQKVIYIYDQLRTKIMYDPKFEQKSSSDVRSLRGLITKQTVCAGYALILKEMLDRQGIQCDYVRGNGHAWNLITIEGKTYPIDLTWDNTRFRSGIYSSFDFLGQDIQKFNKFHHPDKLEPLYGYQNKLSQLDPYFIKSFGKQLNRTREYDSTTFNTTRDDGSKFVVAQLGNERFNNEEVYRYFFVEIMPDGTRKSPLILYSETNIMFLINAINFNDKVPDGYSDAVRNILFSRENIKDSLDKRTFYIGGVRKSKPGTKLEIVKSVSEIQKPEEKRNLFNYPSKTFKRSDGSSFIVQQMMEQPADANGIKIMRYDIFEVVVEDGKNVIRRNTVYTESNLFKDGRQAMVDELLSRERLDRKSKDSGGYIGYYDNNGFKVSNPNLIKIFNTSKKQELAIKKHDKITVPSFEELKYLVEKYDISFVNGNTMDSSQIFIIDRETGEKVSDDNLGRKAIFANIWLSAAGVKTSEDDKVPGMRYAFNDSSEDLYNIIINQLKDDILKTGKIDTIQLFKDIDDKTMYKYNQEVVVRLFRTPYQTELINKMMQGAFQGNMKTSSPPTTLYTMSHAGDLAYQNVSSL